MRRVKITQNQVFPYIPFVNICFAICFIFPYDCHGYQSMQHKLRQKLIANRLLKLWEEESLYYLMVGSVVVQMSLKHWLLGHRQFWSVMTFILHNSHLWCFLVINVGLRHFYFFHIAERNVFLVLQHRKMEITHNRVPETRIRVLATILSRDFFRQNPHTKLSGSAQGLIGWGWRVKVWLWLVRDLGVDMGKTWQLYIYIYIYIDR